MEEILEVPKTEIIPEGISVELLSWDNFKCQRHPQYKVDVFDFNEESQNETRLLCIMCILDKDLHAGFNNKKTVTIKELLQKYFEFVKGNGGKSSKPKNGLEDQFLSFLTNDYIGVYEKHLESQFQIVNQDIDGIIESLGKLKNKYQECYAEELVTLQVKAEDIRKKIRRYLDENTQDDSLAGSSLNQVLEQFSALQSTSQFCSFLKDIYSKSNETSESKANSYDYTDTLKTLEDFKYKATTLEDKVADRYHLQDMTKTINVMLTSGNLMFKKPKGLAGLAPAPTYPKTLDLSQLKMENNFSSLSSIKNEAVSSPYEEIFLDNNDTWRPNDPFLQNLNQKRSRFSDIESQSLRKMRKEIDEKENSNPNHLGEPANLKAYDKLKGWINRRITAYLIFQNTVNQDPSQSKEKLDYSAAGVHYNSIVGHKWKNLTDEEKDEYQRIAKEYKKAFRSELEEHKDDVDLHPLLEKFDYQIKKMKKEYCDETKRNKKDF